MGTQIRERRALNHSIGDTTSNGCSNRRHLICPTPWHCKSCGSMPLRSHHRGLGMHESLAIHGVGLYGARLYVIKFEKDFLIIFFSGLREIASLALLTALKLHETNHEGY